jgi:hypothetical protein
MENEKIIFEPTIAGKKMPLRIEKQQEPAHRQANELLNKRYEMYEVQNKAGLPKADILAMTAYSLAVQVIDLQSLLATTANNKINL